MAEQGALQPLAIVSDYREFHLVIRRVAEDLGVSHAELNRNSGLADRYLGKILAPSQIRTPGFKSLGILLQVLGLKLIVAADQQETERIRAESAQRDAAKVRHPVAEPIDALTAHLSAIGRKGAMARLALTTPEQRRRSAQKAARAKRAKRKATNGAAAAPIAAE